MLALRSGRTARITLAAEDPDGDELTYSARRLPAGATFDTKLGVLTWSPTRAQEGKHEVDFEATDGQLVAKLAITLVVQPNRAPARHGDRVMFFVAGKSPSQTAFDATGWGSDPVVALDQDGDRVSFSVRRLPAGGRLVADDASVRFTFSPSEDDIGEHEIIIDVSDGELTTTVEQTVLVLPKWATHDYRGWFLLGGGPSGFLTHGDGELFAGGALDITLVALTENAHGGYGCATGTRHHDCHASHHRFYAELEVLDSLRAEAPSLFTYGAGYSASFEWYPGRRYLVPHYGIELGGLVRDGLGHRAQTRPYLGLHLWADRQVWLNLTLGYRIVPAELYDLSGPTLALRAVLNPW